MSYMKRISALIIVLVVTLIAGGILWMWSRNAPFQLTSPIVPVTPIPTVKPLLRYSFDNLKETVFNPEQIKLYKELSQTNPDFSTWLFEFQTEGKRATGLANIPLNKPNTEMPIVVLFRGFVPGEIYEPGVGTKRMGEYLAQNGYITLAPDFLGYGDSDKPSSDAMEERFQTYTTALSLLSSLPTLNDALITAGLSAKSDPTNIGIWGHSNGGHIAIAVLAITGKPIPTVLWAPVTKPFPYSILYFTDEYDDNGKGLRKLVADFEKEYDIEQYSPTNYLEWITAPIQLHQGTDDEAVPVRWSDQFVNTMKKINKQISYYTYPGENHNFNLGSWPTLSVRSLDFFNKYLMK